VVVVRLGIDWGNEREDNNAGNRFRFLAAKGSIDGFPTVVSWFFYARFCHREGRAS